MVDLWVQAVRLHDFGMPENLEIDLPVGTTYKGTNKTTIGNLITEYCLEYFTLAFADDVPASPLDVPLECEKRRARV
jgi:hypothetical protein